MALAYPTVPFSHRLIGHHVPAACLRQEYPHAARLCELPVILSAARHGLLELHRDEIVQHIGLPKYCGVHPWAKKPTDALPAGATRCV